MADDFLSKATRELRKAGEAPPSEVDAVRARIMSTMRKSRRRPARTMLWVMPIAAVLAASTALATGGTGLRQAWNALLGRGHLVAKSPTAEPPQPSLSSSRVETPVPVTPAAAPLEAPAPVAPAEARVEAPALAAPAPTPVAAPAAPAVAQEPAAPVRVAEAPKSAPKAGARPSASRAEHEAPVAETINTPDPAADTDHDAGTLGLYKKAHRLHFQQQNFAQALDAWNEYLRDEPNGALAVEARYNRALALVRLGRRDEARAALAPFARGEVAGGYRASEAKSLLSALEGSAR